MAKVVHFEVPSDEIERAKTFYRDVFEWSFSRWDGPSEYWLADTGEGEGIGGGFLKRQLPGQPILMTVEIEKIEVTLAKVIAGGGEIVGGPMTIPGVGHIAYIQDTEGNLLGIMEKLPDEA